MKPFSNNLAVSCALLLASAISAISQPLSIHTLAGNSVQGATNGFGSNARFNHPAGITADSAGNIFVADMDNSTLRKITPDGFASTLAGLAGNVGNSNGTGATARFFAPQGIAMDNAGNLYISDTANATIRKVSPGGTVSAFAGAAGNINSFDGVGTNAQFYQPEGVAVDNAGNVYVSDAWNHTIRKITPAGDVTTLAGLAGKFGATDGMSNRARFNRPASLALDSATNLFLTDSLNHTIRRITPSGDVSTIAGMPGVWGSADGTNGNARFFQPQGIVAINSSNLIVVDSGNQTLRKISASGTNWIVTTVAGLASNAGNSTGTGTVARFNFPAGLAMDGAGHLYVADSGNNIIRTTRTVSPTLQIVSAGSQFVLSWPTSSPGFTLETSPTVGPGAIWTPLATGVVISGDNFFRTNVTGSTVFYRLRKP